MFCRRFLCLYRGAGFFLFFYGAAMCVKNDELKNDDPWQHWCVCAPPSVSNFPDFFPPLSISFSLFVQKLTPGILSFLSLRSLFSRSTSLRFQSPFSLVRFSSPRFFLISFSWSRFFRFLSFLPCFRSPPFFYRGAKGAGLHGLSRAA